MSSRALTAMSQEGGEHAPKLGVCDPVHAAQIALSSRAIERRDAWLGRPATHASHPRPAGYRPRDCIDKGSLWRRAGVRPADVPRGRDREPRSGLWRDRANPSRAVIAAPGQAPAGKPSGAACRLRADRRLVHRTTRALGSDVPPLRGSRPLGGWQAAAAGAGSDAAPGQER